MKSSFAILMIIGVTLSSSFAAKSFAENQCAQPNAVGKEIKFHRLGKVGNEELVNWFSVVLMNHKLITEPVKVRKSEGEWILSYCVPVNLPKICDDGYYKMEVLSDAGNKEVTKRIIDQMDFGINVFAYSDWTHTMFRTSGGDIAQSFIVGFPKRCK